MAKLLKKRKIQGGRYAVAAAAKWSGVSKLDYDVGDTVSSVAVSDDDAYFAVGSMNRRAIVYATADGAQVAAFTAKAGVTAVVFSGNGAETRLLAGSFGGHICMWHVSGAKDEAEVELTFGKHDAVNCMAIGAGGTRLAVAGKSSATVRAGNAPGGARQAAVEMRSNVVVYSVRLPPVGRDGIGTTPPLISVVARVAPPAATSFR